MDFELANFAVRHCQRKGASYAEARAELTSSESFILKNGIPEASGFSTDSGVGIRFIIEGKLGFVSTNELEKEKIKQLIEKGMRAVRKTGEFGEIVKLSEEKTEKAEYEVKQKMGLEDVEAKEKLDILLECEEAIKKTKANVPGRQLFLGTGVKEKLFVNSNGTRIFSKIPRTSFSHYLTVKSNSRLGQLFWPQYGYTGGFETVKKANFPKIVEEQVMAVKENLDKGIKPPEEVIDVIVSPDIVGIMVHESVGHPYEADRIFGREGAQAGESFVSREMLGSRIGSEQVNVSEDPRLEGSSGYYLYDDEGVKARKRELIKNGEIREFLHNRETAAAMGIKSNGAARATGYDREPIVRMSNTFLEPGDFTEEELVADTKKGIYIKNYMEWNIDDKRYNQKYTGAEAYIIRNGRLAEPVFNPTIEITTPKLWQSIDGIAKNTEHHAGSCGKGEPMQAIPVWFGGPSMRLRGVRLSK